MPGTLRICSPRLLAQPASVTAEGASTSTARCCARVNMQSFRHKPLYKQRRLRAESCGKTIGMVRKTLSVKYTKPKLAGSVHRLRIDQLITYAIEPRTLGSTTLEVPSICFGKLAGSCLSCARERHPSWTICATHCYAVASFIYVAKQSSLKDKLGCMLQFNAT